MTLRTCNKCREAKPETSEFFPVGRRNAGGLRPICKACTAADNKARREQDLEGNRARAAASMRKRRAEGDQLEKDRAWREANPDKMRGYVRKSHAKHREKRNAESLAYRWANIDRSRERDRQWHARQKAENPEWYAQQRARARERYRSDPAYREQVKAQSAQRYAANRPAALAYAEAWRKANPDKLRQYNRVRRHALRAAGRFTRQDIERLLVSQRGVCWWCPASIAFAYEVDHKVPVSRGGTNDVGNLCLACRSCNNKKRARLPHEWVGRLL